ncbi:Sodium/solute symporter [Zobellia galactanivorans]|uniref:Sodium/solute symporter n=1 Tax=Zobellia galactanivorans (strain DSM 12802 / CCUG 47099 / CIP 106680 / NCIMB 13871 / Dsij) TaxID=63186 RepID=G0L2N7_ZOBGA|nr:Sodium/solute symporter [Zobellia galactanivorans]
MGYAGMLGGVHNGVVIAAGGANFPEGAPWEGGAKVWSDFIFILENGQWRKAANRLPTPLGYGASIQTPNGILLIGGNNSKHTSNKVFLLSYNTNDKSVEIKGYPDLPESLAYTAAAIQGDQVYVVGGFDGVASTNSLFTLDLSRPEKWERGKDFVGGARSFHSAAIQETSDGSKLFVFGGRNQVEGGAKDIYNNYIAYDLERKQWEEPRPISPNGVNRAVNGSSAQTMGSMHILVYGGDDGVLFSVLQDLDEEIKLQESDEIKARLISKKKAILNTHPGFSKDILAFNTITQKWYVYGQLEESLPVTMLSFGKEDGFYMISGEIAPGVRTPKVKQLVLGEAVNSFGAVNYGVVLCYFIITMAIGLYFSKKQKSTKDYFTGGGRVPWWASGISVFGTLLSALTFMAIPAKSFLTDWSYFFLNITMILIVPVIAFVFIPYFHRLNISTAYEFLENRFNYVARVLGSLSFILFQLGRIGIVLLLPSLAISIVTGVPVEAAVLIMGVLCVAYTTFGGIEAVIWTDVLQVVVLLGGSILAIFCLLSQSEVGLMEAYHFAVDHNKIDLANMDLNFSESTFWVVFLGGLASALITQGTDQTIVQRYLTSTSVKDAQRTSYLNAALTLPATIIFFGIGTLLFIFYSKAPERLPANLSNNDSIFPWYIVNELPIGVSGLLIAAVFSAAMSSISSSLNSVSTAFCNDFYKHFKPKSPDLKLLRIARMTTLVCGCLGMVLALWMANSNIKSLWDQFLLFIGLITAGLGGMFLLGMITKKANSRGTLIGVAVSTVSLIFISLYTTLHILLYSFMGLVICFCVGYVFSLVFDARSINKTI